MPKATKPAAKSGLQKVKAKAVKPTFTAKAKRRK